MKRWDTRVKNKRKFLLKNGSFSEWLGSETNRESSAGVGCSHGSIAVWRSIPFLEQKGVVGCPFSTKGWQGTSVCMTAAKLFPPGILWNVELFSSEECQGRTFWRLLQSNISFSNRAEAANDFAEGGGGSHWNCWDSEEEEHKQLKVRK